MSKGAAKVELTFRATSPEMAKTPAGQPRSSVSDMKGSLLCIILEPQSVHFKDCREIIPPEN